MHGLGLRASGGGCRISKHSCPDRGVAEWEEARQQEGLQSGATGKDSYLLTERGLPASYVNRVGSAEVNRDSNH
jgi:hypothetical protein